LGLLSRRAEIVVTIDVVAPPRGKGNRLTTGTEDSKGQDKKDRKTGAVKSGRNQVRVVLEDARAVVAEIELNEKTGKNLAEDDAGLRLVVGNISGELYKLGEVEIREREASNFGDKLRRALRISRARNEVRYY
jgi:hypothetical protein